MEKPIDRILKQSLAGEESVARAGPCLDAETLAAWSEGTLRPDERAAAEVHAADCARCLAVLAALATTAPEAARQPWWRPAISVRWLAPITAAAAAAALWMVVHPRFVERQVSEPPAATDARARSEPQRGPSTSSITPAEETRTAKPSVDLLKRAERASPAPTVSPETARERRRDDAAEAKAELPAAGAPPPVATPPASAPAAQAPAPAAGDSARAASAREAKSPSPLQEQVEIAGLRSRATQASAAFEVATPDAAVRWRVAGASVERTTNAGRSWQVQQTDSDALLVAGSAPSATVCWLVGRNGTVLLTTDGEMWRRLTSPTAGDLVSVTAEGVRAAVVRTAGGRTYRTTDGGLTWILQEMPGASF